MQHARQPAPLLTASESYGFRVPSLASVRFRAQPCVFFNLARMADPASLRIWLAMIQPLLTLYFRTHGGRVMRRLPLRIRQMALAKRSLDMTRSGSVENRRDRMACNTFESISAVLTRKVMLKSHARSTRCIAGIVMQCDATCIYLVFQQERGRVIGTQTTLRNRNFGEADDSRGTERYKSF